MKITKSKLALSVLVVSLLVPAVALASTVFDDVPDGKFYSESVHWAFDNGVTTGTSATTFSPDDPVTRGQNVTFMYRHQKQVIDPLLDDIRTDINTAQTTAAGAQTAASAAQTTAAGAQTAASAAQTTAAGAQTTADANTAAASAAQTTADTNAGELAGLGERVDAPGQRVALLQWWQETITVGDAPYGVAFDGTHIWTANSTDDTVSKIVATTGAVAATINVGDAPKGCAETDGGTRAPRIENLVSSLFCRQATVDVS